MALMPTQSKLKLAQRSFREVGSTPTAAKALVGRSGRGDPQTVIVGLPDALRLCSGQAAVKESPSTILRIFDKDRVNTASSISTVAFVSYGGQDGFEMPDGTTGSFTSIREKPIRQRQTAGGTGT